MYSSFISRFTHRTAQCVNLLNQMPFTNTTNSRVAAHLTQRIDIVRQQQRAGARARCSQRSLCACVTTTDNDDVKAGWELYGSTHYSWFGRSLTLQYSGFGVDLMGTAVN